MMTHHSTRTSARLSITLLLCALLLQPSAAGAILARKDSQRRRPARSSLPKRPQTGRQQTARPQAAPAAEAAEAAGLKTYALRLRPGQDLRVELERFARAKKLRAGLILTAVGSLQKASLRLANQSDATSYDDKFEIVSLVGTLSPDGVHLHLSLSDGTGKTIGGHLVEGCTIYTTAEIVIGELKGLRFTREQDAQTGYKELRIHRP